MHSTKKNIFFTFTLVLITILFIIVTLKVLFLSLEDKDNRKIYEDPQVASKVVRGNIVDINDKLLAIEVPFYSCSLRVDKISNIDEIASFMAPFVNLEPSKIIEIANNYKYQALIKRKLEDKKVEKFKEEIKKRNLENIIKIEKYKGREYPFSFHSAQTIGFVGVENKGLEGIELALEDYLNPPPGLNEEVTYGSQVQLTLDMNIQYLLDLEVQKINRSFSPESIVAIVMDAKNGDILAMTSYPWYDLNHYSSSSADERQNKVVSMLYEPGSVFKVFSLASVLDINQADFSQSYDCDGLFTFTKKGETINIKCTHEHGLVTPIKMLKYSCNGAISKWALESDDNLFFNKLNELSFNDRIDLPLNGIARSRINNPSLWSIRSKPTISFGQEMSTTALNIATATTALTNEGTIIYPNIVDNIRNSSNEIIYKKEIKKGEKLFNKEVCNTVLEGMNEATKDGGTATKTSVDNIEIGAKTGTAQLYNSETKSYENGGVLASTLAIAPIDNPKYIIYFAAKAPSKGSIWGSNIAGPAVQGIIKGLLAQGKLEIKKE